ncbi:hypothetical protein BGZ97_000426, partial [Linnemannia gamsii]
MDSSVDSDLEINWKRSVIENFPKVNKLTRCPRQYVPISTQKDGSVTFSEKDPLVLFCGQPLLSSKVWELVKDEFPTGAALDDLKT